MKAFFYSIFLCLVGSIVFAQNKPTTVDDYFLQLPEQYLTHIPLADRVNVLKAKSLAEAVEHTKSSFFVEILDRPNGYMKVSSAWDGEHCSYELVFWKKSDQSHLIGLSQTTSGVRNDNLSSLSFFSLKNQVWQKVENISPLFHLKDFIDEKDFKNIPDDFKEYVHNPPITISLPRKGKNIMVEVSSVVVEEDLKIPLSKIKYSKYDLVWNDGKFIKSEGKR
ncbi:MAG: hypothetical protein NZ521_04440 [Flammeovirgaceae bacterium]|nr:hypothetical protein [Flammeovirgaceae bacterium]MDW8287454.1 hypothetical protein [Flammeovirgaceae bacterium]